MQMEPRFRLTALVAALALSACSHIASSPRAPSQSDIAVAQSEAEAGARDFSHRAYATALRHFTQAVALDPTSAEARYDRAMTEEQLGSSKHAEADLTTVVGDSPTWTAARFHLAAAQYRSHEFADAARNFDIALGSNSKAWQVLLDDGVAYYRLGKYADARKRFARALAVAPKSGRAHYWLGMSYQHLGDRTEARNELALAAHSRDAVVRSAATRELYQLRSSS